MLKLLKLIKLSFHTFIFYFCKKEEIKIIRKNFDKITYEFNLSQTDLELVNVNELQEKKRIII